MRLCKPVPHLSLLDDGKILDEEMAGARNKGHGINRKATSTVHVNEMQYIQSVVEIPLIALQDSHRTRTHTNTHTHTLDTNTHIHTDAQTHTH